MNYKKLNEISNEEEIIDCLNEAFLDYSAPIHFDEKSYNMFIASSGVNKELSYFVYSDDKPIGFILNSFGNFNDEMVVFDSGTGIIAKYRGKGIFSNLFGFVEKQLKKYDEIKKYYLEVLQNNTKAINLYSKLGFKINRDFLVLMSSKQHNEDVNDKLIIIPFKEFDYKLIGNMTIISPSFEHCFDNINKQRLIYSVIYQNDELGNINAFCIYSTDDGRIIQLGYKNIDNIKQIILNLTSKFSRILIKNIDIKYKDLIDLLHSIGFIDVASQFEMVKIINN